jgi:hypothetical protein
MILATSYFVSNFLFVNLRISEVMSDYIPSILTSTYSLLKFLSFLILQPIYSDQEILDLGPSLFRQVFRGLKTGATTHITLVNRREI